MQTPLASADEQLLDNPIWNALVGPHASLAIGTASAKRYPPDMASFAGLPDGGEPNLAALAKIMAVGDHLFMRNFPLPPDSGFASVFSSDTAIAQFVFRATTIPSSPTNTEITELNETDVPDMLRLVELAQPGPFLPRTIQLGHYAGIRAEGRLVAMAGERLHLGRFREISAVCTDPAFVRRGYAAQLVNNRIVQILARGEIPFLHVGSSNESAIRLYQKLGFVWRANFPALVLKFVGFESPATPTD